MGRNIQRTMRLLATSTAEKRNTVRILCYATPIAAIRVYRPALAAKNNAVGEGKAMPDRQR